MTERFLQDKNPQHHSEHSDSQHHSEQFRQNSEAPRNNPDRRNHPNHSQHNSENPRNNPERRHNSDHSQHNSEHPQHNSENPRHNPKRRHNSDHSQHHSEHPRNNSEIPRHNSEHLPLPDDPAPKTNKRKLASYPGKDGAHRISKQVIQKANERRKGGRSHQTGRPNLKIGNPHWKIDKDSDPDEDLESPAKMTDFERVADRRNLDPIEQANISDQKLLSKYLPSSEDNFLPNRIPGPDDSFTPGPQLLQAIRTVFEARVDVPLSPPIWFDVTEEAIQHNSGLLKECDFDLKTFLNNNQNSTLAFRSEFRPTPQLEMILGQHPNFPFFKQVLAHGMDFYFDQALSETERLAKLDEIIVRGNHKLAQENEDDVKRLLQKDVHHGFSLPVTPEIVRKLKGAMVQPAGLALQFALLEDGSRVPKRRLTQDSSFALTFPKASVNERIDMDAYPQMIYGWCLSRIIHFIVALRLRHPSKKIFIAKYDYSDAYRRIAHSASAAAQSIIVIAGIAYIALRLTFGGSPNPPTWCAFSEMVTDLSNEIPLCHDWDPKNPAKPRATNHACTRRTSRRRTHVASTTDGRCRPYNRDRPHRQLHRRPNPRILGHSNQQRTRTSRSAISHPCHQPPPPWNPRTRHAAWTPFRPKANSRGNPRRDTNCSRMGPQHTQPHDSSPV